jgi:hypothetical protein
MKQLILPRLQDCSLKLSSGSEAEEEEIEVVCHRAVAQSLFKVVSPLQEVYPKKSDLSALKGSEAEAAAFSCRQQCDHLRHQQCHQQQYCRHPCPDC